MSVTGTIKRVTLDGVTYDVFPDSSIKATPTAYENTVVPTSGRNLLKKVKRAEVREGLVLVADGAEQEALKTLAEGDGPYPMSYETAAGDIYRATGWIEFSSHDTEENRAEVTLLPQFGWEAFLK